MLLFLEQQTIQPLIATRETMKTNIYVPIRKTGYVKRKLLPVDIVPTIKKIAPLAPQGVAHQTMVELILHAMLIAYLLETGMYRSHAKSTLHFAQPTNGIALKTPMAQDPDMAIHILLIAMVLEQSQHV